MEVVEKTMIRSNGGGGYNEEEVEGVPVEMLPGFRFHPTDEELVGFYLRRKVENRPNPRAFQLIQQLDIYKHDPWDLPKLGAAAASSSDITVGEKEKKEKLGEWYFYCKRGRKYRNSLRPNRVTGSGFWKATGIDRPIYSSSPSTNDDDQCKNNPIIGLKKSLVYYRGSAGKGTKTDWMMHEFRLFTPPKLHHLRLVNSNNKHIQQLTNYKLINSTNYIPSAPHDQQEEAEVWTLCRILKRSVTNKKCIPAYWRSELSSGSATISNDIDGMISSKTYTGSTTSAHNNQLLSQQATAAGYNNIISFRAPAENLDQQMTNDLRKKQQQPPNGIGHFKNKNNNHNNEEIINGLEMVISSGQLTMSSSPISEDQYCCYLPSPSITTTACSNAEASNSASSSSSSSSSSSFSTIPADQVNYVVNNFFLNHSNCGDREWELDDELIKSSSSSFVEFATQAHDDPFFLSHIYT